MNANATEYPALFRHLLARSVEAALATLDPTALRLEADARERCLYTLSMALDLADAWPAAQSLVLAIAAHLENQGYRWDWIELLEKGLDQAAAQSDLLGSARFHVLIARLHQLMNNYTVADEHLLQAHRACEQCNDLPVLVTVLDRLAAGAMERSDFARARGYVAQIFARLDPDDPATAVGHHILGLIALRQAEWDEAIAQYTLVCALRTRQGVPRFIAQGVRDLGFAYMYAKRYDEARSHMQQAFARFTECGSTYESATVQADLGIVHWYLGQYDQALACYAAAEPVLVKSSSTLVLARIYNNRGLAQRDLGQYEAAHQSFAQSLELAQQISNHYEAANVLESWGGLYLREGDHTKARQIWTAALAELGRLREQPKYLFDLITRRIRELDEMSQSTATYDRSARNRL